MEQNKNGQSYTGRFGSAGSTISGVGGILGSKQSRPKPGLLAALALVLLLAACGPSAESVAATSTQVAANNFATATAAAPTVTDTATNTPTPSRTPTPTPTNTPTATPTITPTATKTPVPTRTPTSTPTPNPLLAGAITVDDLPAVFQEMPESPMIEPFQVIVGFVNPQDNSQLFLTLSAIRSQEDQTGWEEHFREQESLVAELTSGVPEDWRASAEALVGSLVIGDASRGVRVIFWDVEGLPFLLNDHLDYRRGDMAVSLHYFQPGIWFPGFDEPHLSLVELARLVDERLTENQ